MPVKSKQELIEQENTDGLEVAKFAPETKELDIDFDQATDAQESRLPYKKVRHPTNPDEVLYAVTLKELKFIPGSPEDRLKTLKRWLDGTREDVYKEPYENAMGETKYRRKSRGKISNCRGGWQAHPSGLVWYFDREDSARSFATAWNSRTSSGTETDYLIAKSGEHSGSLDT